MIHQGTIFKGIMLVAGTTIGGGMLALPILSGEGGFIPSVVLFVSCWLFMVMTGLLFLEVCLWMEKETNLVSMAGRTLGTWGKAVAWFLYIFMFYTLTLAYVVGCSKLTIEVTGGLLPEWLGPILFLAFFAPMVYIGAGLIGWVNVPFMIALGGFYFAFVVIGFNDVKREYLLERHWLASLKGLPVAFTAFAFQGLVPTLTRYMMWDKIKVRTCIVLGTLLALTTYLVWQWLILGIVPREGEGSIAQALINGDTAIEPLKFQIDSPYIYFIGQCFAYLALLTSFLGVSLALKDFLADGLQIEKTPRGKLFLCSLIFIPILIAAIIYPGIFLEALGYAGGYGTSLLLGLLPILMVWSGRYRMGLPNHGLVPGGKFTLVLMICFVAIEVTLETLHVFGKI